MPDPELIVRKGMAFQRDPLKLHEPLQIEPVFPLTPLDRDAFEGSRHGYVQTSSGRFGFAITDLNLAARVPFRVGRVYDAGLLATLPGVPVGQEPRCSRDFGPNWALTPTSSLIPAGGGFLLVTDDGGVIPYALGTGGKYRPSPDRPLRFGAAVSDGQGGYRVQLTNGLTRTYRMIPGETNYWLVKEADPSGNALNFTYQDGYLKQITATDGSWVQFNRPMWGAPGTGMPSYRIVSELDSTGRTIQFEYDTLGRMTGAVDNEGAHWNYTWDSNNHVVDVLEPGYRVAFHLTTDSASRTTSLTLDDKNLTFAYTANGTTVTEGSRYQWVYEKDSRGTTTRVTAPGGGVTQFTRDPATADVTRIVDASGALHDFEHDATHQVTKYTAPSVDGVRAIWRFNRDGSGRLASVVPPAGGITTFNYDATGRLIKESADPDQDGTADSITRYERAANGDITAVIDSAGIRTEYDYVSDEVPAVDAHGQVTAVRPPCIGGICPAIRADYDAAGNMVRYRWPSGPGTWITWTMTYTSHGLTGVWIPRLGSQQGAHWSITRSPLGAISSITAPDGGVTSYTWRADGKMQTFTDPLGYQERLDYDDLGRAIRVTDQDSREWLYTWDAQDRLVSRTDPVGRTWQLTYDAVGRVVEETGPGGRVVRSEYDAAGRRTRRVLPGGDEELFTWDRAGRLQAMTQSRSAGGRVFHDSWSLTWDGRGALTALVTTIDGDTPFTRSEAWTYDLAGRIATYADGQTPSQTWNFERDARGRVVAAGPGPSGWRSTQTFDPWSGLVVQRYHGDLDRHESYAYGADGSLTDFSEADDSAYLTRLQYTEDLSGRIATVNDLLLSRLTTLSYDARGNLVQTVSSDGSTSNLSWTSTGRVHRQRWHDPVNGDGNYRYDYDGAGLPIERESDAGTIRWVWDFTPIDTNVALEVLRGSSSPDAGDYRLQYDADGRIRNVDTPDGTAWTTIRDFRWLPGGSARPVAMRELSSGGTTAETRFVGDARTWIGSTRSDQQGAASWQVPILSMTTSELTDDSAFQVGRRFRVIDEGTIALPRGGSWSSLTAVVGGQAAQAALMPDMLHLFSLGRSDVSTSALQAISQRTPDATYVDDAMGLPAGTGTIGKPGLPPDQTADIGYNPLCHGAVGQVGQNCQVEGLFGAQMASHRDDGREWESSPAGLPDVGQPPPYTPAPPLTYPFQAPMKNGDTHPLGVELSNGQFSTSAVDLSIPGRGLNLELRRTFNVPGCRSPFRQFLLNWSVDYFNEHAWTAIETDIWGPPGGGCVSMPSYAARKRRDATTEREWVRTLDGTERQFQSGRLMRITKPGATPIELQWESGTCQDPIDPTYPCGYTQPARAILWSCDDDPETNPAGYADCQSPGRKQELGRFEFTMAGQYEQRWIASVTAHVATSTATRTVTYSYAGPVGGQRLVSVSESCAGCDDNRVYVLARYEYVADSPAASGKNLSYLDQLWKVYDGGATTPRLTLDYTYLLDISRNAVKTIDQPDRSQTAFEYTIGPGPIYGPKQIVATRVTEGSRVWLHEFGSFDSGFTGHLVRLTEPDTANPTLFEYGPFGDLTRKTWPSGRVEEWEYAGTSTKPMSHPTVHRVIPSVITPEDRGTVSCYVVNELTNEPYLTLENQPIPATGDPCVFRDQQRNLVPQATETVIGAMATCFDPQTSPTLYLLKWDLTLPAYLCLSADRQAIWPWLAPIRTTGRAATSVVGTDGNIQDLAAPWQRPVTSFEYHPLSGTLQRMTGPDGTITQLTYLQPGDAGPGAGTADGLGYLASSEVTHDGARLGLTQLAYGPWGEVYQERKQISSESGIESIKESTHDTLGRIVKQIQKTTAVNSAWRETDFHYDDSGRLDKARIDSTVDPTQATRSFSLVSLARDVLGNVLTEQLYATAGGTDGWTGAGISTDRRLAYDLYGDLVQEARLIESPTTGSKTWQVNRFAYDGQGRRVRSEHFESPVAGVSPPSYGSDMSAVRRAVSRSWFSPTTSLLIATQDSGAYSSSGTTVADTHVLAYDGYDRVVTNTTCAVAGFDADGRPTCTTVLNTSTATFDRENRVTETRRTGVLSINAPSTPVLLEWTKTEYDSRGRALTVKAATDPVSNLDACALAGNCNWSSVSTGYDTQDRAVRLVRPAPQAGVAITNQTYDGLGRLSQVVDPLGNVTTVQRDGLGHVTQTTVTDAASEWPVPSRMTSYGFDGLGNRNSVTLPGAGARTITRRFNARGQLTDEWPPLGTVNTTSYRHHVEYDGLGRRTRDERHIGGTASQVVTSTYDLLGRLRTATVMGQTTTYTYDAQGRRLRRKMPDGRQERTAYDSAGRLTRAIFADSNGTCPANTQIAKPDEGGDGDGTPDAPDPAICVQQDVTYYLGGLRQAVTVSYLGVTATHYAGSKYQHWDWDGLGRTVESLDANGVGAADDVQVNVEYDGVGHPIAETVADPTTPARHWRVGRSYDAAGNLSAITYPNADGTAGRVVSYGADALGRISTIAEGTTTHLARTYAGAGRLMRETFADHSIWQSIDAGNAPRWDTAGRRTGGSVMPSASGVALWDEDIAYDANDRVTSVVWNQARSTGDGDEIQTYAYDEMDRLISFEQAKKAVGTRTTDTSDTDRLQHSFTLDELGNWQSHTDQGDALSPAISTANAYSTWPARVDYNGTGTTSVHTLARVYDEARGFLFSAQQTASMSRLYLHDGFGRLAEVKEQTNGSASSLLKVGYDASGRLAWRQTAGQTEVDRIIYSGDRPLLELRAGVAIWIYTWAGDQLVAATDENGKTAYAHTDRMGSVVLTTVASGAVAAMDGHAVYDPYGRAVTVPRWDKNNIAVPFGFAGARLEASVGLYVMGARWYDPATGRFIEQDPIGEAGGPNLYGYVNSSPTMWHDRSGLSGEPLGRGRSQAFAYELFTARAEITQARGGVTTPFPSGLGYGANFPNQALREEQVAISAALAFATGERLRAKEAGNQSAQNDPENGASKEGDKTADGTKIEVQEFITVTWTKSPFWLRDAVRVAWDRARRRIDPSEGFVIRAAERKSQWSGWDLSVATVTSGVRVTDSGHKYRLIGVGKSLVAASASHVIAGNTFDPDATADDVLAGPSFVFSIGAGLGFNVGWSIGTGWWGEAVWTTPTAGIGLTYGFLDPEPVDADANVR